MIFTFLGRFCVLHTQKQPWKQPLLLAALDHSAKIFSFSKPSIESRPTFTDSFGISKKVAYDIIIPYCYVRVLSFVGIINFCNKGNFGYLINISP